MDISNNMAASQAQNTSGLHITPEPAAAMQEAATTEYNRKVENIVGYQSFSEGKIANEGSQVQHKAVEERIVADSSSPLLEVSWRHRTFFSDTVSVKLPFVEKPADLQTHIQNAELGKELLKHVANADGVLKNWIDQLEKAEGILTEEIGKATSGRGQIDKAVLLGRLQEASLDHFYGRVQGFLYTRGEKTVPVGSSAPETLKLESDVQTQPASATKPEEVKGAVEKAGQSEFEAAVKDPVLNVARAERQIRQAHDGDKKNQLPIFEQSVKNYRDGLREELSKARRAEQKTAETVSSMQAEQIKTIQVKLEGLASSYKGTLDSCSELNFYLQKNISTSSFAPSDQEGEKMRNSELLLNSNLTERHEKTMLNQMMDTMQRQKDKLIQANLLVAEHRAAIASSQEDMRNIMQYAEHAMSTLDFADTPAGYQPEEKIIELQNELGGSRLSLDGQSLLPLGHSEQAQGENGVFTEQGVDVQSESLQEQGQPEQAQGENGVFPEQGVDVQSESLQEQGQPEQAIDTDDELNANPKVEAASSEATDGVTPMGTQGQEGSANGSADVYTVPEKTPEVDRVSAQ